MTQHQLPSIGRIVTYTSKIDNGPGNNVESPAIILACKRDIKQAVIDRWGPEPTEVGPSPVDGKTHETAARPEGAQLELEDDTTVHLLVFGLGKDYREYAVKYSVSGELGTWRWPDRV